MRRRFNEWAATIWLLSAAVVAASCGSSATTATSPTALTRCAVTASGTNSVPAQGGAGTVSVTAARECSWSAAVEGAWLAIKSGSAGQGDGSVEFTASANPDPATRRGAIVLNDQRLEVVQGAADCVITLSENASSFPQSGGSGRIDVRASSSLCTWTAQAESSWITVREPNGKGSASVPFEVAATTGPPRSSAITIAGQRFSVTQAEGCAYAITPESHSAASAGSKGSITITTSPGCPWTAGSNVGWLTLSETAGSGPGAMSFTVAPTTGTARTGMAVIAGLTFTVSQSAGCTFVVDPLAYTVGAGGGVVSVGVTSAAGCQWSAASSVPWITLSGPPSASGSGAVNFSVEASSGPARTETVTVAGQAVTITQTAATPNPVCTFTVSPETVSVPAAGGTSKVSVNTTAGCAWTAASSAPWIQITSSATGSGPGDLSFSIASTTGGARAGTLVVAGKTVTVNQETDACSFTLSATSQSVPAAGGSGTVNVTTTPSCTWTASSNAAWLSITGAASTTGSGTVSFTAAAEGSGVPRTGTLTIAGQTFTVTQAAGCTYAIAPDQQTVDAAGGTVSVAVTAAAGCPWTMATTTPWLTLKANGPGNGSGNVQVSVAVNNGAARTGTATIAGRTFTVNQTERVCTYTVKPLEVTVNEKGKVERFDVTAAAACTWTAVSHVPWMIVTRSATGSGSTDVWVYIVGNNGADRTGMLTIAGHTVTVRQKGEDD